jgi:hypothetical protein
MAKPATKNKPKQPKKKVFHLTSSASVQIKDPDPPGTDAKIDSGGNLVVNGNASGFGSGSLLKVCAVIGGVEFTTGGAPFQPLGTASTWTRTIPGLSGSVGNKGLIVAIVDDGPSSDNSASHSITVHITM